MFGEIVRKSGTYSLVPLINRGASFLLLPIFTRVLTPADYGVMELLDLTTNIVGLLLGTRIGQALFYFYFTAKDEEGREKCLSSLYIGSIFIGAICASIMAGARPLSSLVFSDVRYAGYLRLVFASFGVSMVGELNLCYLRATGKAMRYVIATVITLALNIAVSLVLLLGFHLGVRGVLIAGLVSSAVTGSWLAWSALSQIHFRMDWHLLLRMLRYSIPLSVSGLAMFLVHFGDRIFLRSYATLAQIGVYGLAYKFAMVVPTCHQPFVLHWNAQVRAILDRPEGRRVYVRMCTYVTAGLALVAVLLALFIRPVMVVMAGHRFFPAANLVPPLAAAYVIRAVGAHLQSIFIAEGRPDVEARVNVVGAAVCMAAYAVLIPSFKLWGAVAATLIGFITILVYGFYCAQRLHYFDFEYGRLLRIAILSCVTVGIFYLDLLSRFRTEAAFALVLTGGFAAALIFTCSTAAERTVGIALVRRLLSKRVTASAAEGAAV